jgi:predicted aspartyl protease
MINFSSVRSSFISLGLTLLVAAGFSEPLQANEPIGEGTLLALDGHYACLDVTLRDGKSYPFIVDTGSYRTFVLEEFGQSQKLAVVKRETGITIGASNQRRKVYELGEVIVGGARWPQIRALSVPLRQLRCAPGINAVGALGMDFLSQPVIEFDFPNRKFRIFQPKSFRYSGQGARVAIRKKGTFVNRLDVGVTVTNTRGKAFQLTMLLDTGAPGSVLDLAHGAGIDLGLYELPYIVASSGGASGEKYPAIIVRVPEVQVGADVLRGALSAVHEAKRGFAAVRQGESGILGLGWAKHRRWFLDYQHDQIFVEPGPVIEPAPQIGVNAWFDQAEPGKPWILTRTKVVGSVDLAKGLRLGDELLSINGKSNFDPTMDTLGAESAWMALTRPVEVTLKIRRSGKTITLKFTPAELLPMNPEQRH